MEILLQGKYIFFIANLLIWGSGPCMTAVIALNARLLSVQFCLTLFILRIIKLLQDI